MTVHPRGVAVQDARADLAACIEELARSELVVADYYAGRGATIGEQLRLANAAILYPDTAAGKEARERLTAAGLDPARLAQEAGLNSADAVKYQTPRWEREAAAHKKSDDNQGGQPVTRLPLLLLLAAPALTGCVGLQQGDVFPDDHDAVCVSYFTNETFYRDVEFELTEQVVNEILSSPGLKLSSRADARSS